MTPVVSSGVKVNSSQFLSIHNLRHKIYCWPFASLRLNICSQFFSILFNSSSPGGAATCNHHITTAMGLHRKYTFGAADGKVSISACINIQTTGDVHSVINMWSTQLPFLIYSSNPYTCLVGSCLNAIFSTLNPPLLGFWTIIWLHFGACFNHYR